MTPELIIGLEETPQGHDALALGALLAEALGAKPLIASAVPLPVGVLSADAMKKNVRAGTKTAFASALDELDGMDAETCAVASRSPGEFLSEIADSDDATAIVIGSNRHGALGRVFPGSVGQNLLHGAGCAVAVAPRGYAEQDQRHLHRIGVAFDASPEAWVALRTATRLAEGEHATLSIITVAEPIRMGYGDPYQAMSSGEYIKLAQHQQGRILAEGVASVPADLTVHEVALNGEAGHAIAGVGEELDLIVIGSRGYGPLKRTLLGSASSQLIRRATCPVLVLPRAAGEDPLRLSTARAERASFHKLSGAVR